MKTREILREILTAMEGRTLTVSKEAVAALEERGGKRMAVSHPRTVTYGGVRFVAKEANGTARNDGGRLPSIPVPGKRHPHAASS